VNCVPLLYISKHRTTPNTVLEDIVFVSLCHVSLSIGSQTAAFLWQILACHWTAPVLFSHLWSLF